MQRAKGKAITAFEPSSGIFHFVFLSFSFVIERFSKKIQSFIFNQITARSWLSPAPSPFSLTPLLQTSNEPWESYI